NTSNIYRVPKGKIIAISFIGVAVVCLSIIGIWIAQSVTLKVIIMVTCLSLLFNKFIYFFKGLGRLNNKVIVSNEGLYCELNEYRGLLRWTDIEDVRVDITSSDIPVPFAVSLKNGDKIILTGLLDNRIELFNQIVKKAGLLNRLGRR